MKFKVYSPDGTASKDLEFSNFPSFADDKGVAALRQVVIAHQANARQGNASTKTRAEVAGSGKKLFRQKGVVPLAKVRAVYLTSVMVVWLMDPSRAITAKRLIAR